MATGKQETRSDDPAFDAVMAGIERADTERESRRMESIGIAKRYQTCRLENYLPRTEVQRIALQKCRAYVEGRRSDAGCGLVLSGTTGGGKTHLLTAILHAERSRKKSVRYTTMEAFFVEMNSTYRDGAAMTEKEFLDSMIRPDVLVVDDVFEINDGNQYRKLWHMIDRRYSAMRATLTATNLTADEMRGVLDDRTRRRFDAQVIIVDAKGGV